MHSLSWPAGPPSVGLALAALTLSILAAAPSAADLPGNSLTDAQVACDRAHLSALAARSNLALPGRAADDGSIRSLFFTYSSRFGAYEGMAARTEWLEGQPPAVGPVPETLLSFHLGPDVRELLVNPERPLLDQVSLTRERTTSTPGDLIADLEVIVYRDREPGVFIAEVFPVYPSGDVVPEAGTDRRLRLTLGEAAGGGIDSLVLEPLAPFPPEDVFRILAYPVRPSPRPIADRELLALAMGSGLTAEPSLYERLVADLAAIGSDEPVLEDSIFYSFHYNGQSLLLTVDDSTGRAIADGDYDAWDCLNAHYGSTGILFVDPIPLDDPRLALRFGVET